ncbi:MAG: 4Fe-4S binding protein [Rhodoferax sp.]
MTREDLGKYFPPPYIVGEKDTALPVWPLFQPNFQQNVHDNQLIAYLFESIDLAPVPGFSGVPVNLLVALDVRGNFLDVKVLSQHEPVFVGGVGEGPLNQFVGQYKGLSLKQNIKILTGAHHANRVSAAAADLDGVTKATASVRIINQSILSSALKVARKKLGFAEGRDPELIAQVRPDVFESHSVKQLLDSGLLAHFVLRNAELERKFADSEGSGLDAEAIAHPQEPFIDLYMAYVSVPTIGRNLLQEATWNKLQGRLDPGDQAVLVMSSGRYSFLPEDFVPGSTPDRLVLRQDQLPMEIRDLNIELALKPDPLVALPTQSMAVFRIISGAGLDPSRPLDFGLPVLRLKGAMFPERIVRDFNFSFHLPDRFYTLPEGDNKSWDSVWHERRFEVIILLIGLAVLSLALARQRWLVADQRRFTWLRRLYLLYTLGFIGWYAQGQLSIVNLTSVLQALVAGRSLAFFLFDPMTVSLSAFVCITLVVWGRGTFCGWLCPFGALQEFLAIGGRWLRIRPIRLKTGIDSKLKRIKYLLLAGILVSAVSSTNLTDWLVEVEPFKTSITLNFVRAWPFVVYAVVLLLAGMFVYKFFCRFLCPFGAALALLGRWHLLHWIERRAACAAPCQTCRFQCEYEAIAANGKIHYDECFQCMDCVIIHASDERCAPLLLEKKRARVIPIHDISHT